MVQISSLVSCWVFVVNLFTHESGGFRSPISTIMDFVSLLHPLVTVWNIALGAYTSTMVSPCRINYFNHYVIPSASFNNFYVKIILSDIRVATLARFFLCVGMGYLCPLLFADCVYFFLVRYASYRHQKHRSCLTHSASLHLLMAECRPFAFRFLIGRYRLGLIILTCILSFFVLNFF